MKNKKLTAITLSLAAAAVSATLGGALLGRGITSADETVTSYALTKVFSTANSASIGADATTSAQTAITLPDDASVSFKNHLAYKWYEKAGEASYLTLKFAFADTNFESVTLDFDAPSAWATKDDKTTNTVTFTKGTDGALTVKVNDTEAGVIASADVKKEITLALDEGAEDGEFTAAISYFAGEQTETATNLSGKFTNVGANYVTQSSTMTPLKISANFAVNETDLKTVVHLKEINGQKFDTLNESGEVPDTAAPVFVVNEAIDGFLLGSAFGVEYDVIDVLKKDSLSEPLSYYQYDYSKGTDYAPTDDDYKTLDTSVYFMEKVFADADNDNAKTTGYIKYGAEYFSVKAKLGDGENTRDIDLSWYATAAGAVEKNGVTYMIADRNTQGATYTNVKADEETSTNIELVEGDVGYDAYNADYDKFVADLNKEAASVSAGSNSKVNIPSLKWLINDNNGYRNLNFTICYKTPSSDTASVSSALSHNQLKLSVSDVGWYEFKVFAVDEANNEMKYYDEDGKLVSVSGDNIWDIEEIPSFRFEIKTTGMKVEEPEKASSKKETVILNKTYTMEDIDVTGADENKLQKDYALYKVDLTDFSYEGKKISESTLTAISYETLTERLDVLGVTDGDYFASYLKTYATLLAEEIGIATTDEVVKSIVDTCFERIGEANDKKNGAMDEDGNYVYAAYNWNPESKSFETVEEATYMILADYYESDLATKRAAAFKIVVVESEADYLKGETEWLKNNIVSVILFSVAGVMLILIIILLLVKPSDETLDDVDAKAAVKKEKKEKTKKNK